MRQDSIRALLERTVSARSHKDPFTAAVVGVLEWPNEAKGGRIPRVTKFRAYSLTWPLEADCPDTDWTIWSVERPISETRSNQILGALLVRDETRTKASPRMTIVAQGIGYLRRRKRVIMRSIDLL